ncbi:hypothetical protein HYE60_00235 [Aggregatibacter actinomycetemcomitans]|uniref:hypothetical protein n=1 Tax=Aggregatibacter actinomycetemcomitans TaxID=714 RepID=UPI00197B7448|nr:hypothetical protein [Aggregatibacter actinomycetemcomitans]MBN6073718.1 hypothetical protein [Aggregatibacter actinomycetemcomitans]
MEIKEFHFDDDLEMVIHIPQQKDEVILAISDELDISTDNLTEEYKQKINLMLSQLDQMLLVANQRLNKEFSETNNFRLLQIILLSEYSDPEFIVGLMFRVEQDVEHGRGMKISINSMEIIEYGLADVAFSLL